MQHPEEYPDFFDEHSLFGFILDDSKDNLEFVISKFNEENYELV